MHKKNKILPREFYQRDTVTVARDLLGKTLVRKFDGKKLTGIIIETEAYAGKNDPASHASHKKTERNKAMFDKVGISYVYFTYGMYYCFNIVARKKSADAGAVLIRSIKPKLGITHMTKNRKTDKMSNLTNGPGKLSQALKITMKQYSDDLTKYSEIYVTDGPKPKSIISSPRIGISVATDKLWNFSIKY